MTTAYLVLFDADRIKDYVFATGRLKEIRGASEQVRLLTDDHMIYREFGLPDWHPGIDEGLIYAGGGAGAALFASEERAREFCVALENRFRRITRSATLSAVYVPVEDSPARAQKCAAQALARRKASRPQAEVIPGGGAIRFCESDRLRPAGSLVPDPDRRGLLVSEATAVKRLQSRELREQQAFLHSRFWKAFEAYLPEADRQAWRGSVSESQDLGSIGEQSRPFGYVALVYGDGDGIGRIIGDVVGQHGFEGYQQFSQALTQATHEATAQALADAYKFRPPHTRNLPFEVITIGGDDVILICTAERGVAVACALSRLINEKMQEMLNKHPYRIILPSPVSASVGVVIAHDSLPIVQLERRGAELLKSAKSGRRKHRDEMGWVDFHIVSTPGLDTIEAIRKRDYQVDKETLLTMRPYRRETAEHLLQHARCLHSLCSSEGIPRHKLDDEQQRDLTHMPTSKRADLYRACRGSRVQTTLDVLTIHTRLKAPERMALLQALRDLGSANPYPFAASDDNIYRSALPDLLEVAEFVAEEGTWE